MMSQSSMTIQTLGLPVEFVPVQSQPVQPIVYGIQGRFGVAVHVRVIDSQHHSAVMFPHIKPVENESPRTADMQVASRRWRKASPNHEVSVYRRALISRRFNVKGAMKLHE